MAIPSSGYFNGCAVGTLANLAHKILIAVYHMLANDAPFRELVAAYLDHGASTGWRRRSSEDWVSSVTMCCCSRRLPDGRVTDAVLGTCASPRNVFSGQCDKLRTDRSKEA